MRQMEWEFAARIESNIRRQEGQSDPVSNNFGVEFGGGELFDRSIRPARGRSNVSPDDGLEDFDSVRSGGSVPFG